MSRFPGLALVLWCLGGCSTTILLGNPYPDAGGPDAGPVPTVEVLPNPLDFGSVSVDGGVSVEGGLSITFQNAGGVAAVVNVTSVTGPFSAPAMLSLATGAARKAPVTFRPTATGPVQGVLSYRVCPASGTDCSPSQSITLQGSGF